MPQDSKPIFVDPDTAKPAFVDPDRVGTPPTAAAPGEPTGTFGRSAQIAGRAVAPAALAAGVGAAAAGVPTGGALAVPGAVAGVAAYGLEEITSQVYNAISDATGGRIGKLPPASEVMDRVMDKLGIAKPKSKGEKAELIVGRALTGGATGRAAAEVGKAVAETGPAGKVLSAVAGLTQPTTRTPAPTIAQQGIREWHAAGYKLPPTLVSTVGERPSFSANILEGWAGKGRQSAVFSTENQKTTDALAKKALGMRQIEQLTPAAIESVRSKYSAAYEAPSKLNIPLWWTSDFDKAVTNIDAEFSNAAKLFPGLISVDAVNSLKAQLMAPFKVPPAGPGRNATPEAVMETIRKLRADSKINLAASAEMTPQRAALGLAQYKAAGALETLIESNLPKRSTVLTGYREARKAMAQTYAIENALNTATGQVDGRLLSMELKGGKFLSDEIKLIADFVAANPKYSRTMAQVGSHPAISMLEAAVTPVIASDEAGARGFASTIALRPIIEQMLKSDWYQRMIVGRVEKRPTVGRSLEAMFGISGAATADPVDYIFSSD